MTQPGAVPPYLVGLDVGSSRVKGVLLTGEGSLAARAERPVTTSVPAPGHAEQSPDEWYRAVIDVVRALMAERPAAASHVRAIGVTGAAHIPVLLDRQWRPVRPAILWSDRRSTTEAAQLQAEHGDLIARQTYNAPSPTWTLPMLVWLRAHEPQALDDAEHMVLGKDDVVRRLTGELLTDTGSAASSLMFDVSRMRWSPELVELATLPPSSLPRAVAPHEIAGELGPEPAGELGLPAGTPVIVGGLDSVMELVALGISRAGSAMLRMGTAGGVMALTETPAPHHGAITYPFLDRGWCVQAFTSSCTSALAWIGALLRDQAAAAGAVDDGARFELLDSMAASVASGAEGVLFHPYLAGERAPHWDPYLRASFVGLEFGHGRGHLVRAVMEGVACSLHDCLQALEQLGHDVEVLMATGGGTRSDIWSQIVADVLARPFRRVTAEGSAVGVAMVAGVGVGVFDDLGAATARCVSKGDEVRPHPESSTAYRQVVARYRAVTAALRPIYRQAAEAP